jgi:chorismate mutase
MALGTFPSTFQADVMNEPDAMQRATACRGIRGATTVAGDGADAVDSATGELLDRLLEANGSQPQDVAAAIFTLTDELAGANPAAAARARGWDAVPFLMVREHGGAAGLPNCLRVLLLLNTTLAQAEVRHVYLHGASALRPDLAPLG